MSAKILVLYPPPADPAAFDKYYFSTHIPLARKIPHLAGMKFNAAAPNALAGTAPYLIAELEFASMADLQAGMASPEGQATAADVPNFASNPTILIYETRADG
jgi:uncharacterized protein (TIGR02118 family)